MPNLKFVAQFPIIRESAPIEQLQAEAIDQARAMLLELGFIAAADWVFELLDLPMAIHMQCTAPVQPLNFSGVK